MTGIFPSLAFAAASLAGAAQVLPTPRDVAERGTILETSGFAVRGELPEYARASVASLSAEDGTPLVVRRAAALADQEYVLEVSPSNVTAEASSDAGFIYAVMTLRELAVRRGGRVSVPCCRIADRPAFALRGINWNLFVECRGWSQDLCDGEEAFVRRSVAGFDRMARFKLNAVLLDGVGWNPERFPGYGRLMRRLSGEARKRGIRIGFAGYNAGYGAQYFPWDGPKFTNLTERGESFACFGAARSPAAGVSGTCLSDERLVAAKAANLRAFVEEVDPGFLYIHGFDADRRAECERQWKSRCARCRARWPNDDTLAADGMAGAFADFYDRLHEAADNGRCIFNFVSPNYTCWSEGDAEWRYHRDYFKALTNCLRSKSLRVMLREQYFGSDGKPRFAELRRAVGPDARLSAIVFSGCDGFYNSHLFTADVALARCWKGIDEVIVASGNAYQEPRQVAIAEYLWNPEGSPYQVDVPTDPAEFPSFYGKIVSGEIRPERVFGPNGLLRAACVKLYGPESGPEVAAVEDPACYPILPMTSKWMPGFYFAELRGGYGNLCWSSNIVARAADIVRYRTALTAARDATLRAEGAFRKAGVAMNADACRRTRTFAEASLDWTRAMELALEARRDETRRPAALQAVARLERTGRSLQADCEALRRKALDPSGADVDAAVESAKFLVYEAESMRQTLERGTWRDHPRRPWW